MAAPSYTTDLTTTVISACDVVTNFAESSDTAWDDGGSITAETDFYIQGSACISEALKTGVGSIIYNYGSGVTFSADDVLMAWHYCTGPSAMAAYSAGGIRMIIGSGIAAFYAWKVWGSDYYTYGGWICIPVDPTITPDYTVGAPTTTKQYFGSALNLTGTIAKGNTHGLDVMRKGRAKSIFEYGDSTSGYCTFSGFAAQNDNSSNRWGVFQAVSGGYLWQGLMSIGTATNACQFTDSNKLIFVAQQMKVYSSFNKIAIYHANSIVNWTNIVFKALGTVSRGDLEMINDAVFNLGSCSFIDMGNFTFDSNCTVESTNFVGCQKVTQAGGTFNGCTFDSSDSTAALVVDDISVVTNCTFVSGGTGYGIEGFSSAGSYTLDNLVFSGYSASDGTTGNEMLHVLAVSGTVTLNYTGTEPSVHSAGATIEKVGNAVTVKVTVKDTSGTLINGARVFLKCADGSGPFPYQESVSSIVNSGTTATVTHNSHGLLSNDYVFIEGASLELNNGVHQITKTGTNTYTYTLREAPGGSPTGTITSTYVPLYGVTSSGYVSTSRVYSSDQNITGWVRKGSGTPKYKTSYVIDTVNYTTGLFATAVMVSDE